MASERTTKCKKLKNLFFLLSTAMWVGTVLFVVIMCLSLIETDGESMQILSEELKEKVIAFGITAAIGLVVALFIKEKARTALYMISLVITVIIKGEVGMYIILAVWGLDEYVFHTLYKSFKNKYIINKEIDLR